MDSIIKLLFPINFLYSHDFLIISQAKPLIWDSDAYVQLCTGHFHLVGGTLSSTCPYSLIISPPLPVTCPSSSSQICYLSEWPDHPLGYSSEKSQFHPEIFYLHSTSHQFCQFSFQNISWICPFIFSPSPTGSVYSMSWSL